MIHQNATTKDLANLVFRKLKGAKVKYAQPQEEVLDSLFETIFYASLKTEEGQFINVTVTLIDPSNPDPSPPDRVVADRWNFVRFKDAIPFNVKNLVKLSKAADPWSSSLAVFYDADGELTIWGMINQAVHYQSFLNYEKDEGPEQPGFFQASITGIGCLIILFDYELIATLKQNILISNYIDVFKSGDVSEALVRNSLAFKRKVKTYIEKSYPEEKINDWEEFTQVLINQSISRMLLRIQNYQHGGAFLIATNTKLDLDIKYKINYDRLSNSLADYIKLCIRISNCSNKIYNNYLDLIEDNLPLSLYLDENVSEAQKKDTGDEIKGAIRFISSLSCVDGLVVFSRELKVQGFGAVIKLKDLPEFVYTSKTAQIREEKLVPFSPNHFGTRHRSMFSYCWHNQDSLGFVVSQDGDIRAIMRVGDKLIMWENIKVQQFIKSKKLIRLLTRKV
jgi:hypothetical protein